MIVGLLIYVLVNLQGNLKSQSKYWLLVGLVINIVNIKNSMRSGMKGTGDSSPPGFALFKDTSWVIQLLNTIYLLFPVIIRIIGIILRLRHLLVNPNIYERNLDTAQEDLERFLQSQEMKEVKGTTNLMIIKNDAFSN